MYLGSTQVYSANPITITAQPTNQTSSGGAATFSVSATASPGYTISYQWQYYSPYNTGSSNISGATSATLSLTGLASGLDNGNQYSCILSTTGYSVVSSSATLTVPNRITITVQPSSQTITGTTASFTCTATISGGGTPSYTWYRQNLGIGSFLAVSGGTSSTLSLSGLSQSSNNGDKYFCQVSYSNEAVVTSSTATLTVGTGSVNKLAIARNNGSTASFSGTGVSGAPYTRSAGYYYDDAEGVSHYTFTLNASGTVYMSCNCADETDSGQTFSFRKNGTAFATSGNGGQSSFSANTTGSSGDVFKITANSASGSWSQQLIDIVSIYAT